MLPAHQFEVGPLDVGVGDDSRGLDRLTVVQPYADGPAFLDQDPFDRGLGAHLAAVGLDDVDQAGREDLAAAPGIVGAAVDEEIEQARVECDRGARRWRAVVARLAQDHRARQRAQPAHPEQAGHRQHPDRGRHRRTAGPRRLAEDAGPRPAAAAFLRDAPEDGDAPAQPALLRGEGLDEASQVGVPPARDAEGQPGKDQGGEAVRVQLAELDPVVEAEAAQRRGDRALGVALADVVHADIELVPVSRTAEHLAASAGDLVLLQHQGAPAAGGQVGGAGEPAQSRADNDDVPRSHDPAPCPKHRGTASRDPTRRVQEDRLRFGGRFQGSYASTSLRQPDSTGCARSPTPVRCDGLRSRDEAGRHDPHHRSLLRRPRCHPRRGAHVRCGKRLGVPFGVFVTEYRRLLQTSVPFIPIGCLL